MNVSTLLSARALPQTRELHRLILDRTTVPIALIGRAGTGKTVLLQLERARLRGDGHLVVLLRMREVARPEELTGRVVDECLLQLSAAVVEPELRAFIDRYQRQGPSGRFHAGPEVLR